MKGIEQAWIEPHIRCVYRPEFGLPACRTALATLRAVRGREAVIKASSRRKIFTLEIQLGSGRGTVVVKQFLENRLWDTVKSWVRTRPALRAWRAAIQAFERGVPTAAPFALIEDPAHRSAWLVMEFLEGWTRLDLCLRDPRVRGQGPEGRAGRWKLLEAVAHAVRALHDSGVDQSDFVAGNILVREASGSWSVVFIDLDSASFRAAVSSAQRVRAMGKLDASLRPFLSRAERLRGLCAYAQGDPSCRDRSAIRRILAVSSPRILP